MIKRSSRNENLPSVITTLTFYKIVIATYFWRFLSSYNFPVQDLWRHFDVWRILSSLQNPGLPASGTGSELSHHGNHQLRFHLCEQLGNWAYSFSVRRLEAELETEEVKKVLDTIYLRVQLIYISTSYGCYCVLNYNKKKINTKINVTTTINCLIKQTLIALVNQNGHQKLNSFFEEVIRLNWSTGK